MIHALIDIRDNPEKLPQDVSEELYKSLKGANPSSITSWIRFECSFGSKFENGFAKAKDGKNYAGIGYRSALKQSPKIQNVDFICDSYENLDFENCLVYCDPPYQGTTGYKTGSFDHDKFFEWCREQAKKNVVFVSEYNAPEDFELVWQGEIKTNFASNRKKATHKAVEKLFKVP